MVTLETVQSLQAFSYERQNKSESRLAFLLPLIFIRSEDLLNRHFLRNFTFKIVTERARSKPLLLNWHKIPSDKGILERYFIDLLSGTPKPLTNVISKALVEALLKTHLSENLIDHLLKWYQLDKNIVLTPNELSALMIGVKANLTLEDLQKLTAHSFFQTRYQELLPLDSGYKIATFVTKIREANPLPELPATTLPASATLQLNKDIEFLKACTAHHRYKPYPLDLDRTITITQWHGEEEYLARDLIYGLFACAHTHFQEGVLFPVFAWEHILENRLTCYAATHLISQQGIYAALLMPALQETPFRVTIAFRGTYDYPSLLRIIAPSLNRFFGHLKGVGLTSFYKNYDALESKIIGKFQHIAEKFGQEKFEVRLTGHSMGGGDAAHLASQIVNSEALHPFISKLVISTWNATAVPHYTALHFLKGALALPHIHFDIRRHHVQGDLSEEVGSTFIGYSQELLPEHIQVSLIRYQHPDLMTYWHLRSKHTQHCLTNSGDLNPADINPTRITAYLTNSLMLPFQENDREALRSNFLTWISYAVDRIVQIFSKSALARADQNQILPPPPAEAFPPSQ